MSKPTLMIEIFTESENDRASAEAFSQLLRHMSEERAEEWFARALESGVEAVALSAIGAMVEQDARNYSGQGRAPAVNDYGSTFTAYDGSNI